MIVYPGRLILAIDDGRKDIAKHPTILGRTIGIGVIVGLGS